jgi:integrase
MRGRHFTAKIQEDGRRDSFPLRTANKAEAAARAAKVYGDVVALGWEAALEKHKPNKKRVKGALVGDLVSAVKELADVRPPTLARNIAAFRRIVADVCKIDRKAGRFAPCGEGRETWLAAVDTTPLAKLAPHQVEAWKLAYVAGVADKGEARARAARNSANSILRAAKSLFSKRLLRFISPRLLLPSPLPFDGVDFFPRQSMRYAGGVDVNDLIGKARVELGGDSSRSEEWKALILCLFAGLRRNEADKLRWRSIDLAGGLIRIEAQADFSPKAETSLGEIPIEDEVCAILRGLRAREPKAVYVLAGGASKAGASYQHYRAADTFDKFVAWLRANGIDDRTPLHTLRKEAGSLMNQKAGLFEASRFLRHANVSLTAAHYASKKDRHTVGLGALLSAVPSNVVPMPAPASKPLKARRAAK